MNKDLTPLTFSFLDQKGLDKDIIIPWLNEYGGYCDCEVIYNVDEAWGDYVGREYEDEEFDD